MEQRKRPVESHEQALHRLALKAAELGVKIYVYDVDGPAQYFATSVTQPGHLYRVTAYSCQCRGFLAHQKCQHLAALLDAIGELPPLPTPPTPAEQTARRAERVDAQHAAHIEAQARRWLEDLLVKLDRGEDVPERDLLEACDAVNLYSSITGSNQTTVALAA